MKDKKLSTDLKIAEDLIQYLKLIENLKLTEKDKIIYYLRQKGLFQMEDLSKNLKIYNE